MKFVSASVNIFVTWIAWIRRPQRQLRRRSRESAYDSIRRRREHMIENNGWKSTPVDQYLISRQRITSTGNEQVYVLHIVCYSLPALFNCNPHLVIHILDHSPGNHLIYACDCATLARWWYYLTVTQPRVSQLSPVCNRK